MTEQLFVEHSLSRTGGSGFRVRVLDDAHATGNPPVAAIYGEPTDDCLVRIHSRCVYSEILGSVDCDCHDQVEQAKKLIIDAGAGVIVYLDQEGRGAGLLAKARGYVYSQKHEADTFTSYRALHLPDDSRDYAAAADLLESLGLTRVRLLTNNPEKMKALEDRGIIVKREPSIVPVSESARAYLEAKRQHGHLIPSLTDS
ncbi:GTP cyclohydrolase II [Amycolatopsis pittospori]|uniref:GTP cyclohydrolase II n=1 Tax=Amycolatopsis pittospori TaxID=2749434 RepID=UPI0015F04955|nr:GTP cyclohydrolase II [Amycolatopsis pittospori]